MKFVQIRLWIHWYLLFFSCFEAHYIVFEEVGTVASSVAYLHIEIPLNVSSTFDRINKFKQYVSSSLKFLKTNPHLGDEPHTDWHIRQTFEQPMGHLLWKMTKDVQNMTDEYLAGCDRLSDRLKHVQTIMPFVAPPSSSSSQFPRGRVKRMIWAPLLAKAIFGTIHGLYSHRQYRRLRQDLNGVIREQGRTVDVVRNNVVNIEYLKGIQDELVDVLSQVTVITASRMIVLLQKYQREMELEVDRIFDAVQAAQHRRLSITLLSGDELHNLFDTIKMQTANLQAELLLTEPSDLFQTELSYAFDGSEIVLVLHVPVAAKRSTLRLFRFLPFPLDFSKTHFLLPQPEARLLAISSDEPRLSVELQESDLSSCYKLGRNYMCERMGILSNTYENSCLGSLYAQRFKEAMNYCEMQVAPLHERVIQLSDNWFLIYSTTTYTSHVTCRNGTSNEHHLKVGVNKIPLSSSCSMKLQQYQLFADSSLQVESQIKEFKWDLEAVAFPADKILEASQAVDQISEAGALRPDLEDVQAHIAQNKRSPAWLYFFILIGIVAALALGLWIFCFVYTHNWINFRDGMKLLYDFIWPPKDDPRLYSPMPTRKSKKKKKNIYDKLPSRSAAPSRRLPPPPASSSQPLLTSSRPSHHRSDSALPTPSQTHLVQADVHYDSDSLPSEREDRRRHSVATRVENVTISTELSELLDRARNHTRSMHQGNQDVEMQVLDSDGRRSRSQPREIPAVFARHRRRFP